MPSPDGMGGDENTFIDLLCIQLLHSIEFVMECQRDGQRSVLAREDIRHGKASIFG